MAIQYVYHLKWKHSPHKTEQWEQQIKPDWGQKNIFWHYNFQVATFKNDNALHAGDCEQQ